MKVVLAAVAVLALSACAASPLPVPAAVPGTVTGTVVIAPCTPVQRVGDPPCPPRPGINVHFEQASVNRATAVTDATGTYRATLAPGAYDVWAEGGIGRGRTVPVTVVSAQTVTLNLNVDSGIR
jgi:type 1 fimbria pilin